MEHSAFLATLIGFKGWKSNQPDFTGDSMIQQVIKFSSHVGSCVSQWLIGGTWARVKKKVDYMTPSTDGSRFAKEGRGGVSLWLKWR